MRGYFGIGVEGINKPYNVGNVFRTAHAFDASFVFTVAATYERSRGGLTDTSDAPGQMPFFEFPTLDAMTLPQGCTLVGVELDDDAIELPSFRHPVQAAYVLGPERGSLSPGLVARCEHIIRIPTRFSLNVGMAGVIVMYDRLVSRGRFPARPVKQGGPTEGLPAHVHGGPVLRQESMQPFRTPPPTEEVKIAQKAGSENE